MKEELIIKLSGIQCMATQMYNSKLLGLRQKKLFRSNKHWINLVTLARKNTTLTCKSLKVHNKVICRAADNDSNFTKAI